MNPIHQVNSYMDLFIARQPIFTQHKKLFAYELLYRGTLTSTLDNTSGNRATTSVLSSTFLTEGIDKISGSKPCFINFTRDLLLQNLPASFPKTQVVVEVLEDIPATKDVVDVCTKLKNDGYTIALDDFEYDRSLEPLIEIADIIKFDFRLTPMDSIHRALHKLARYNLKYLAEKVESHEEFIQASKLGFSYFQGYFFCKPERMQIREIDSAKVNLVALLSEVSRKTSVKKLAEVIERDVAIAYKLLRYVNSSYFYRVSKVESVEQAIAYLGANELRRFVILVIISELASDKPPELLRLALVRAEMCRLLARGTSDFADSSDEIFLLGLFSLLDAMLDSNHESICGQLNLSDNLAEALVKRCGLYASFLDTIVFYERGRDKQCIRAAERIGFNPSDLQKIYLEAVAFAQSVLDS